MSEHLRAVSKRNLIVISGYYGFDNLGDEAILEELLSELKRIVAPQEIVVLSNNPANTSKIYGVQSANRWRLFDLIRLLRKARLFISGGGGLFQDASGPISVVFYGGQILAARTLGAPVLIYAQGLGPLRSLISQILTSAAWKMANWVTVRDELSQATAQSWAVKAELTADPVWSLQSSPLPPSLTLSLESESIKSSGPLVAISLRPSPKLKAQHMPLLAQAIQQSLPPDSRLIMLPLQKTEDEPVLRRFRDECDKVALATATINTEELATPSQWLALMQKFDMVIGMRLHALLMAIRAGKAVVGLPYDPKVTYLCNTFSQPLLDLTEEPAPDSPTSWKQIIAGSFVNRSALAALANSTVVDMQEKSCQNFNTLARILRL